MPFRFRLLVVRQESEVDRYAGAAPLKGGGRRNLATVRRLGIGPYVKCWHAS